MSKILTRMPEQAKAANPAGSVWVSANAGAGKTFVLADRVVRLLLGGTNPGSILCLTFTRAAAAEMQNRVFGQLAGWATASPEQLAAELKTIGHPASGEEEMAKARTLFARALETPGGLKIQTIHAFCERLLHQFPLEANVPAHFEVIDDGEKAVMLKEAQFDVIREALENPDGEIAMALGALVAQLADSSFEALLDKLVRSEGDLRPWLRTSGGLDQALDRLAAGLGVEPGDDTSSIVDEIINSPILPQSEWPAAIKMFRTGSSTDNDRGNELDAALNSFDVEQIAEFYKKIFLKNDGQPRIRSVTKTISVPYPEFADMLDREKQRVFEAVERLKGARLMAGTRSLFTFGLQVMDQYQNRKVAAGKLEYRDLVENSLRLLGRSDAASWVLYKLDGGIDHILVDEAQDTSPEQWEIVRLLAEEAQAGFGARARGRTIFAVGDEKQSIYSFQGAEPARFDEMRRYFARKVKAAEQNWEKIGLHLSFRSVPAIMEAVDKVFADGLARVGLTSGDDPVSHTAYRKDEPGLVEIWPVTQSDALEKPDAWDAPLDRVSKGSSPNLLAEKIAERISGWLKNGEKIAATGEKITPGDILILVRTRTHIVVPLIRALREKGVAVAGADRLVLQTHLAVMDLLLAADFVLLPEDDLTLATLLRSPLIDASEDNLYALAYNRRGSLWRTLQARADDKPYIAYAARLAGWLAPADFHTPYSFFAKILGAGGRRQLIARLGPEAHDAIDEFLNLALKFEQGATPSLQNFVHWMRAQSQEIKRSMDQITEEVRIMTVHGAKGLEAPIVFLPDTCGIPDQKFVGQILKLEPKDTTANSPAGLFWAPGKAEDLPETVLAIKDAAYKKHMEEQNRLLYVAMTRARDRLYVCGHIGKKKQPDDCWYSLIETGLDGDLSEHETADGQIVRRFTRPVPYVKLDAGDAPAAIPVEEKHPLSVSLLPPPAQAPVVDTLAPSRIGDDLDHISAGSAPDDAFAGIDPRRRGTIIHKLIEILADFPDDDRSRHGDRLLEHLAEDLEPELRSAIRDEAIAVINKPDLAFLFGNDSRAETPIAGQIANPGNEDKIVTVSGIIDRLVVGPDKVVIADFKSNRIVPQSLDEIPQSYITQMAAYRGLLQAIYTTKKIETCLVWTANASMTRIE